jgi:hypothetical protein
MISWKIPTTYLACILIFLTLHLILPIPIPSGIEVYKGDISFNGDDAYNYAYTLAKSFPKRHVGSPDNYKAFQWLSSLLSDWGYDIEYQEFKVTLETRLTGRNIVAFKAGEINETIAILTNYDMVPMSIEAASDTAGAVGVVLELAEIFSNENTHRNVLFVFVDSEEWGMQGAKAFITQYKGAPIKAVLVVEDLAIGKIQSIYLESMGQFEGYSPLWLRDLAVSVGEYMGLEVIDPVGIDEYILRAIDISFTDQGPIIANRVSSIELSTRGDRPEWARVIYHNVSDVMEYMEPYSFKIYGMYVERIFRSLDNADEIPPYKSDYLKMSRDRYIPGVWTYVLPTILALPIFIHTLIYLRRYRSKEIYQNLIDILPIYIGILIGLSTIYIAPYLGLMPLYDTYPPPPKHPLHYNPSLPALLLTAISTIIAIIILRKIMGRREMSDPNIVLLSILSIATLASLIYNRFGTVVFLSQAIYLWPWIRRGATLRKIFNLVLLLLGLSLFIIIVTSYAAILFLKWEIIWYLYMGVAYGQFQLPGNLIAALIASLIIFTIKEYIVKD